MRRVAILTPDPGNPEFHSRWRDVFAHEKAALAAAGIAVEGPDWANGADLGGYDLVMPLMVWGYHHEGPRWQAAVDRWEEAGARIANSPSVLRWNADKLYLGRLAERGAPVVPTRYVDRADEASLLEAAQAFGTDRLIAKPQVSASAYRTIRWSPGAPLDGGPHGPAIIQPYLPAIETEGEVSLVYFAGAFSHAISKRPQPGDFRVQPEYDGIIAAHDPSPDERAAAEAILAAVEEPLLYARVDLVRGLDGAPQLMELELVEPDLYLQYDVNAPAAFAQAVARRCTPADRT